MSLEQYIDSTEGYFKFSRPKWLKYSVDYSDFEDVSLSEIERVFEENEGVEQANQKRWKANNKLYNDYAEEFYVEQFKAGAPVYGVRGGVNAPYKKILYNLKPAFKVDRIPAKPSISQFMYNGTEYRVGGSPVERIKKFLAYAKREQEREEKSNVLLVASIAYANNNEIDIEGMTSQKVIDIVDEHSKTKFIAEKYPNGTDVDVDDNICECELWIVGDRRCSCGNRRIYLEIDGNLLDGYYAYPQPY